MNNSNFLNIPYNEQVRLRNFFQVEESLLSELEYCESKIKSITAPYTAIDVALLAIYQRHFDNITNLLEKLHTSKQFASEISPTISGT